LYTRTTTAAIGLLTTSLLLVGCSGGGDTSKAAAASPTPTISKQDKFLQAVRQADIQGWADTAPTDDEIAAFPEQWCGRLAEGHSVGYIIGVGSDLYPRGAGWGTYVWDAYRVLILGVTAYCPQYRAEVVQQARAAGKY